MAANERLDEWYTWEYMWGGLDDGFQKSLEEFVLASKGQIRLVSGYRDEAYQAALFADGIRDHESRKYSAYKQFLAQSGGDKLTAVNKWIDWNAGTGAVGKWVARPGSSNHNGGVAADLRFVGEGAQEWAHANAANFGLGFPMGHEEWHIEPVGLRSGTYEFQSDAEIDSINESISVPWETTADAYTNPPPGIPHAMEMSFGQVQGAWIDRHLRGPGFSGDLNSFTPPTGPPASPKTVPVTPPPTPEMPVPEYSSDIHSVPLDQSVDTEPTTGTRPSRGVR